MSDNRPLDVKGTIEALEFDPGKQYVVFVDASVVDAESIMATEARAGSPDVPFIFCHLGSQSLLDAVRSIEVGQETVIFVKEGIISDDIEIPGVKIQRVTGSPHWALAEYRRAKAGWVPDHIPMIPIRGGHQRWDEETDREYFLRIVESATAAERERAAKVADSHSSIVAEGKPGWEHAEGWTAAGYSIATRIRSGE